jgi:hypothetical protein
MGAVYCLIFTFKIPQCDPCAQCYPPSAAKRGESRQKTREKTRKKRTQKKREFIPHCFLTVVFSPFHSQRWRCDTEYSVRRTFRIFQRSTGGQWSIRGGVSQTKGPSGAFGAHYFEEKNLNQDRRQTTNDERQERSLR